MAAGQLSSHAQPAMPPAGDAAEPISVARTFPKQEPAAGRSGCNVPALQAELSMLQAAAAAGKTAVRARTDSEKVKEVKRLLRQHTAAVPLLDKEALDEVLPLLRRVAELAARFAPVFADQRRTAQAGDKRKDSDRSHKALFDRRKKQRVAAAASAGSGEAAATVSRHEQRATAAAARVVARAGRCKRSAGADAFVPNKPQGRPALTVCLHLKLYSFPVDACMSRQLGWPSCPVKSV